MTNEPFNKITGTPRQRNVAKWGCLTALVLVALVIILIVATERGPEADRNTAKAPIVTIDTSLLPVLNITFGFDSPPADRDLISAVADAVHAQAERAASSPAEGRSLTAVNFEVRDTARADRRLLLHFSIKGADFYSAAASRKPAGYYLTITNEAGANVSEAETAARDYCGDTAIAFCAQVLGK